MDIVKEYQLASEQIEDYQLEIDRVSQILHATVSPLKRIECCERIAEYRFAMSKFEMHAQQLEEEIEADSFYDEEEDCYHFYNE